MVSWGVLMGLLGFQASLEGIFSFLCHFTAIGEARVYFFVREPAESSIEVKRAICCSIQTHKYSLPLHSAHSQTQSS